MKIGTKSLLFGVHQVFLHPLFVLWGWKKLYDWPNWKELVCIVIHDWGYWGCSDMDGGEGEKHTFFGAKLASVFFDKYNKLDWYYFCLNHSRFCAKRYMTKPSKLCWADKFGTALMPTWLWAFLARLSGEVDEYLNAQKDETLKGIKDPHKFFKKYKNELVPALLKEHGVIK